MSNHVVPLKTYYKVFGGLMLLTAFTTWIAHVDLGFLNTPVALSIACVKLWFVVLYFMHVKFSGKLIWVFAATSVYFLIILFGFMMSDYLTRIPVEGWEQGLF